MREIALNRGYVAYVDDYNYDLVSRFTWYVASNRFSGVYAKTSIWKDWKAHTISMHRLLSGAHPGEEVDHIDGNGLNNTVANLRICCHANNMANMRRHGHHTSNYKGVSWNSRCCLWVAQLHKKGEHAPLIGYFHDEQEAARAYDRKALKVWGPFAHTNFPSDSYSEEEIKVDHSYSARIGKTSAFRGVHFDHRRRRWCAQITVDKKHKHLGRFATEDEAAAAYQAYVESISTRNQ